MESPNSATSRFSERPRYLEWVRLLSAFLILTYGMRKLIGTGQFARAHALGSLPVGALSGIDLTWFYYAYSHAYGTILGLTQVLCGLLLLARRTALLGAAILTPVVANILMINIFFHIALGAELVAAFVLASSLLLLWQERKAIFDLFWSSQKVAIAFGSRYEKGAIVVLVLAVLAECVLFARIPAR